MTDTLRGFRVMADVLLDVSDLTPADSPHAITNPNERAAIVILDALAAADINLCGLFHVSKLRRDVNPETGEITWKR